MHNQSLTIKQAIKLYSIHHVWSTISLHMAHKIQLNCPHHGQWFIIFRNPTSGWKTQEPCIQCAIFIGTNCTVLCNDIKYALINIGKTGQVQLCQYNSYDYAMTWNMHCQQNRTTKPWRNNNCDYAITRCIGKHHTSREKRCNHARITTLSIPRHDMWIGKHCMELLTKGFFNAYFTSLFKAVSDISNLVQHLLCVHKSMTV